MQQAPSYFTTAFNPSGNHFIPQCSGALSSDGMTRTLRTPRVFAETFDDAPLSDWIVGSDNGQFMTYGTAMEASNTSIFQRYDFMDDANATWERDMQKVDDFARPGAYTSRPFYAYTSNSETLMPLAEFVGASVYSSSVPLPNGDRLANMAFNGDLPGRLHQFQLLTDATWIDVTSNSLAYIVDDPLTDAAITYSANNQQWAVFHGSTDERYVHGALGDNNEAFKISILYWDYDTEQIEVSEIMQLPGDTLIFEGLAPMWADLDGDGVDDLLTTVADRGVGAQLRAYLMATKCNNGNTTVFHDTPKIYRTVESDYIGTGNRWLHQLGVGPLGVNGDIEMVQCMTPHIGGIIRYHRLSEDRSRLEQVHAIDDGRLYTTHAYRSRNLDQVAIGDFNNDGIPEVVLTNFRQTTLVGLQRTVTGTEEVWSVDLPEWGLASNIAVSCGQDDKDAPMLLFTTPNHLARVVFEQGDEVITENENVSSSNVQSIAFPCAGTPDSASNTRHVFIVLWSVLILYLLHTL